MNMNAPASDPKRVMALSRTERDTAGWPCHRLPCAGFATQAYPSHPVPTAGKPRAMS
jgi:hypothetical protein